MNATSQKRSPDRTDDDPAATHASTNQAIATPSPPKHPTTASNATTRDSSSRSQLRLN
jgi:hypothetical protein